MNFPLNYGQEILTRIELRNELSHDVPTNGMAGNVGLIGAVPSEDLSITVSTNYSEFLKQYNITPTLKQEQYDGARAAPYLFMEGIKGYSGASTLTCVNYNDKFVEDNTLLLEMYNNWLEQKAEIQKEINILIDEKKRLTKIPVADRTAAEKLRLDTDSTKVGTIAYDMAVLKAELDALNARIKDSGLASDSEDIEKMEDNRILTFNKLKTSLKKMQDEDIDLLFISGDLRDTCKGNSSTQANNIGESIEYILKFIENSFYNSNPMSLVTAVRLDDYAQLYQPTGIPSETINVNGNGDVIINPDDSFDFSGVKVWGARQFAHPFSVPSYQLGTSGLFFQGGTINGNRVGAMEFAAHMCGWIASLPVSQDLTNQTIPGVSSINEELQFGLDDAGTVLNNYGIQVVKPKNRLKKLFSVNNSVMPSGWHTNHVRSVNYLMKKISLSSGLGMNNLSKNLEVFKTSLDSVAREVINEVEVIESVEFGDIEVLSDYHIFLPMDIILSGIVTKISVGVSMQINDSGASDIDTRVTTGYNMFY